MGYSDPSDGLHIKVELDDAEVRRQMRELIARGRRLPLKRVGVIGVASVLRNFRVGGRPKKWPPSKRVQGGRDSKGRYKKRKGKTLQDTGRLMKSVDVAIYQNDMNVMIYTDLVYAPPHQYGWKERNIPARPFMLWQKQDIAKIQKLLGDAITGEGRGGR